MQHSLSDQTYDQLCELIPGGVNSPFRSFHLVGGKARVLKRGQGSRVWDVDDREYIDLCCGWGPLTLGHAHPAVVKAVQEAAAEGVLFGAPTPWELDLARMVTRAIPSMEMVRFVNSGAEAVMSTLRVARSVTGRAKVVKFEGCYHGHVAPLDAVGHEAEQHGGAVALGATPAAVADTLLAEFNNLESVKRLFAEFPEQIACVIMEPVTGSMGVIEAEFDFLAGLQSLCKDSGALLIFDEVLTGFRVDVSAQKRLGVSPDLTCLGKAVAGGLPAGAYGGKAEYMKRLSPLGPIYQAGTFCGNPITMRAGLAAQEEYLKENFFESLAEKTAYFSKKLAALIPEAYVPHVGGMFSVGFGVKELRCHRDALGFDEQKFAAFFHAALAQGVYLPPSTWDSAALSSAHTYEELDLALQKLAQAASVIM
ncbi:MAG: glutamate-1-semialdehyde 2,1-aminomutase [Candidatus Eremiobacteraeota bacterium]|nr:glutamate-1-semialdehyde 2,1-aminomutase [Candidatus Eremiobacteraeota bacterium]